MTRMKLSLLSALILVTFAPSLRPSGPDPWTIGVLFWHPSPNDRLAFEGVRAGLNRIRSGTRLHVEDAETDRARAVSILESFQEQCDLIFAMGTQAALLAAEYVKEKPIVFTAVTNPVLSGLVPSWHGSRRNLAGSSNWIGSEQIFEVFGVALPGLKRLGILRSKSTGIVSEAELSSMRLWLTQQMEEPNSPSVDILERVIRAPKDLGAATRDLVDSGVQAIWIPIDFTVYDNLTLVLEELRESSVPLVSSSVRGARAGAIAGIHVDYRLLGERAVVLARRILEEKRDPGSLRIETMSGYRVVVNPDAAREVGYELPLSLLVIADDILEGASD